MKLTGNMIKCLKFNQLVLALGVFVLSPAVLGESSWHSRYVGADWVWFEDYAFAYAEYTLYCQENCECEVGMGMKIFGKPRGEIRRFSGVEEIFVVGLGAVHVRKIAGPDKCIAAFTPGKASTFNYTIPCDGSIC